VINQVDSGNKLIYVFRSFKASVINRLSFFKETEKKDQVQVPLMAPPAGFGDSPEHVTLKTLPGKLLSNLCLNFLHCEVKHCFNLIRLS